MQKERQNSLLPRPRPHFNPRCIRAKHTQAAAAETYASAAAAAGAATPAKVGSQRVGRGAQLFVGFAEDEADEGADEDDDGLMPCPYCGAAIYEDSPRCPKCENYLSDAERTTTMQPRWIVVTAVVLLVVFALFAMWH